MINNLKKGRGFLLLPFFVSLISCTYDPSKYGRVSPYNTADKNSFVFSVNDEFVQANANSPKDEKNPKMTKAEATLLTALLKQKKYCMSDKRMPSFTITSRQEKIYDMTFAHLIEENYNARPVAPRMYFGQCSK